MFEVGALANRTGGRVVPYCIGGITKTAVGGPMSNFNGCDATADDTRKMVKSVAEVLEDDVQRCVQRFETFWAQMEKDLAQLPGSPTVTVPNTTELLQEILALGRAAARDLEGLRAERDAASALANRAVVEQALANMTAHATGTVTEQSSGHLSRRLREALLRSARGSDLSEGDLFLKALLDAQSKKPDRDDES